MAIQDRCMLTELTMTSFTGERTSKRDTADLLEQKQAERGAASVVIRLVPKASLRELNSVTTKLREVHKMYTAPWGSTFDILPVANFFDHSSEISAGFREREKVADDFIRLYPSLAGAARQRLGDLDFERLWLPAEQVRAAITHRVRHMPVPSGSDFRADLDEVDRARITAEIEADVKAQAAESIQGVKMRLVAELSEFVDRIKDYRVEVDDRGVARVAGAFRDSVLNGLTSLGDVLPKLNFTDDPALAAAHNKLMVCISGLSPQMLRENPASRLMAIKQAEIIVKSIS